MRTVLPLSLALACALSAAAQPGTPFRAAAYSGGGAPAFLGTTWTYVAGAASTVDRFAAETSERLTIRGHVGDRVALHRTVLPGALPASVRSASHLVFDARGEGVVFVALEVGDRTEPYLYPVTLHPGAQTFRIPLERFRQRKTRAAFRNDTVTRVSFYVVPPSRNAAPAPFALTIGRLAFAHKAPLAARY